MRGIQRRTRGADMLRNGHEISQDFNTRSRTRMHPQSFDFCEYLRQANRPAAVGVERMIRLFGENAAFVRPAGRNGDAIFEGSPLKWNRLHGRPNSNNVPKLALMHTIRLHHSIMASLKTTDIYLATQKDADRSHLEDQLVLDGANVSCFASPSKLWERFQVRPVRFVVTDRRFDGDFDGMELVRRIRQDYRTPHVYILMRSIMSQLEEIKEGLNHGVDDYLIIPHNPFQIRSRVLVGMRWISYMDSLAGDSGS